MANRNATSDRGKFDLRQIAHEAMLQRGMLPDFSPDVLREVTQFDRAAGNLDAAANVRSTTASGAADPSAMRDLRGLLWASIDNDDSRDLDQLSVCEELPEGNVRVLVAIADVDALVKKGSAIDGHAWTNTTSVYTAAQIFPMLPEQLSTDLTSLNQDEDRSAIVIELMVSPDSSMTDGDIYRAIVRNHAKLAYNSVAAWLDNEAPAPEALARVPGLEKQLRTQDRVAQSLRSVRHRQGALQLETIEARAVYDGETLVDLQADRKNRAKELIEDFMVAANGVTARFLDHHGYPSLRRILREPKRWDRIIALAAEFGTRLPATADAPALDAFLDARRSADPDHFPDVSLAVVKMLGSGEYALELPGQKGEGHFGLAVRDYNHSTAPNRRFPDLIAQRLMKAAMQRQPSPYTNEELTVLAKHCTEQEDSANKVERQVRKSAAALLLHSRIGDRFDAIVTGASEKGTWVRISHPAVEGRVVRGFDGLDVGDHVLVQLLRTDVERGFIDFARADSPSNSSLQKPR